MSTPSLPGTHPRSRFHRARSQASPPQAPRRWLALGAISLAQMMAALDATVVSIALPSAQQALHASDAGRQWVVTAYTLAFAGLLLPGGRLADTFGRRRTFLAGLAGFALASAAGGAAPTFGVLLAARAAQGACAALLIPSALSLLSLIFTQPGERARAFAVFGAVAGTGGALGLLLGGVLTEYAGWRWCLYVNVPVALTALLMGRTALPPAPRRRGPRADVPGALLVTAGLVALVYGLSEAASLGWSAPPAVGGLAAGAALLAVFGVAESRAACPLVPLPIVVDRNRGGCYLAIGLTVVAMYGVFLLLSYDFQAVLGYSPVRAGLAFLPLSAASLVSSTVISRALLPLVPPRALITPGLLLAAAGMALFAGLPASGPYLSHVLPGEVVLGLGMGAVFVPAFSTATLGVGPGAAGIASALASMSQQIGASLGTALLNTVATAATAAYLAARPGLPGPGPAGAAITGQHAQALVHGYATAAGWAAVILLAAAVAAGTLIDAPRPTPHPAQP